MNATISLAACQESHKKNYSILAGLIKGKVFSFKRDGETSILMVKKIDFPKLELLINNPDVKVETTVDCYRLIAKDPSDVVSEISKLVEISKESPQNNEVGELAVA